MQLYSNNASGTLAALFNIGDTTLTLVGGGGANFPSPAGGDFFIATVEDSLGNYEIIKVTTRAGDAFTVVVRAQEGTTEQSFAATSRVECRLTAASMAEFLQINSPDWAHADHHGVTADGGTLIHSGAVKVQATAAGETVTGDQTVTGTSTVSGLATFNGGVKIGADTLAENIADTVGAMLSGNTETGITATYQDADNTIDLEVDPEFIADTVGAMFSGNTETGIAATYQDADNTIDLVISDEYIQDLVGAMFSGNTETGITVTYQDSDGTIDLVVSSITAKFESAEQSIATSGNVAHSMAGAPDNFQGVLRCTSVGDQGYVVGDEVDLSGVMGNDGNVPIAVWANVTHIGWAAYQTTIRVPGKSSATWAAITNSRWRIVLKAQRF